MGICSSNQADVHNNSDSDQKTNKNNKQKVKDPEQEYKQVKVLGVGASCQVVCASNKRTQELVAMKIIDKPGKSKETEDNEFLFNNEVKILSELKHPNILEFVESFQDEKKFYLITKMCHGGELFDRVAANAKGFSEAQASKLAYQMILALKYCHSRNIMHRDLKPENFVFDTEAADSNMKLIDFGCAVKAKDDEVILDVAGSPYYVAPEVLSSRRAEPRTGRTWKASDMWSIGVIIFLLVHGYPPFNGESQDRIFHRISVGRFRFNAKLGLSKACKDLISQLLQMKPLKRLTAAQALQHPWIAEAGVAPSTPLPEEVTKGLKSFDATNKLKKAVGHMLAGGMSAADEKVLQENFDRFDTDGNGKLDAEEIKAMLDYIGGQTMNAQQMLEMYDDDKSGNLDFNEFKAAYGHGKVEDEDVTRKMFFQADTDGNGAVDAKELAEMLKIDAKEAADMIAEVDDDGNGTIDFDEWKRAMQSRTAKRKK